MKSEILVGVFMLVVLGIVLIFSDFRNSDDLVLDTVVFIVVAGAFGFGLWLRDRIIH